MARTVGTMSLADLIEQGTLEAGESLVIPFLAVRYHGVQKQSRVVSG